MSKDRNAVTVFSDKLLRASFAVESGGAFWLVPNSLDGWEHRSPLVMTAEARKARLTLARGADLSFLGIPPN
jgi:hypothetical protein